MQFGVAVMAALEVGGYISVVKCVVVALILLGWAKGLTFIDKDAKVARLPREMLNSVFLAVGLIGFAALFLMPTFAVGFSILLLAVLGTFGGYVGLRAKKVGLADLKQSLAASFAKKKTAEEEEAGAEGEVQVMGKGGVVLAVPSEQDPYRPAYEATQTLLSDVMRKNADRVDLRPAEGQAAVQITVDGVAYTGAPIDLAVSQAAITYLKMAAGLDVNDRRKPQTGVFKSRLDGKRHELEITTMGSTSGESLRLVLNPKKRFERSLSEIEMHPAQLEVVKKVITEPGGIVLVATPKGQGLTSLTYAILRSHDAFLTHIQTLERFAEIDLEGITQTKMAPNASPAEELKQVEWLISQQIDIIMIDQLTNPQSARELVSYVASSPDKRIYIGMRAGNTFDAIKQWRKLVGDDAHAVKTLRMVIAGRLMRKLCIACKVAIQPDPETLRKLNLDPQRITKLFIERKEPMKTDKGVVVPCEYCQELRFKGRIGVFEIFDIDDDARQAILSGGTETQLKASFRKQRARFMQEMALMQVEAGETSVQEVLRAMKSDAPPAPPAAGAPAAATARKR